VVLGGQIGGVEEEVEPPPVVLGSLIRPQMVVVVEVVLVMAVGRVEVYIFITVILDTE